MESRPPRNSSVIPIQRITAAIKSKFPWAEIVPDDRCFDPHVSWLIDNSEYLIVYDFSHNPSLLWPQAWKSMSQALVETMA